VKQGLVSELGHRLGWLNIFNPMHCDGFYRLDLGKRDQRIVAQMLVVLSAEEPGENVSGAHIVRQSVYCKERIIVCGPWSTWRLLSSMTPIYDVVIFIIIIIATIIIITINIVVIIIIIIIISALWRVRSGCGKHITATALSFRHRGWRANFKTCGHTLPALTHTSQVRAWKRRVDAAVPHRARLFEASGTAQACKQHGHGTSAWQGGSGRGDVMACNGVCVCGVLV
jgi:hypothetical protein